MQEGTGIIYNKTTQEKKFFALIFVHRYCLVEGGKYDIVLLSYEKCCNRKNIHAPYQVRVERPVKTFHVTSPNGSEMQRLMVTPFFCLIQMKDMNLTCVGGLHPCLSICLSLSPTLDLTRYYSPHLREHFQQKNKQKVIYYCEWSLFQ